MCIEQCSQPQHRGAHPVRLLQRELAPPGRRGRQPDGPVRRGAGARVADLHERNGVRLRFIGDAAARCGAAAGPARGRRGTHRRQQRAQAAGRRELRRPLGHRAGGAGAGARVRLQARCVPEEITEERFAAATCARRTCRMPSCSSAPAASSASAIFCCGTCAYAELFFTPRLWPDFDGRRLRGGARVLRQPRAALRAGARATCLVSEALRKRIMTAVPLGVALLVILLALPPASRW